MYYKLKIIFHLYNLSLIDMKYLRKISSICVFKNDHLHVVFMDGGRLVPRLNMVISSPVSDIILMEYFTIDGILMFHLLTSNNDCEW